MYYTSSKRNVHSGSTEAFYQYVNSTSRHTAPGLEKLSCGEQFYCRATHYAQVFTCGSVCLFLSASIPAGELASLTKCLFVYLIGCCLSEPRLYAASLSGLSVGWD